MDLSGEKGSLDPFGHKLFAERVRLSIAYLGEAVETPSNFPPLETKPKHWIITGVGSSEAHGRFLTYLINSYTSYTAEFWALSQFISSPKKAQEAGLIVLSQGLSNNAQLALKRKELFGKCVLFSSVTETTGTSEKKAYLQSLKDEGVLHISYTPDNEYTLLIRVAGPLTGYLACLQWVQEALEGEIPPKPPALFETLEAARKKGKELANKKLIGKIQEGCILLTQAPFSQFSQNLSYKLIEGLFAPMSQSCDILSFSHGPFQALCAQPAYALLLLSKDKSDPFLLKQTESLLKHCTTGHFTYQAELPTPWNTFEYEMLFNGLLEAGLPMAEIDQINWPGKGKDRPLYDLNDLNRE